MNFLGAMKHILNWSLWIWWANSESTPFL